MRNISLLLLLVILHSCKANKDILKDNVLNQYWKVEALKNYSVDQAVRIKIMNITNKDLIIFNPLLKNIEKFNEGKWIKISNPYCPCGGCPPPPESITIAPKKEYTFNWNKTLTTCKNNRKTNKLIESGSYRVTFNYGESQTVKSFKKLTVEFEI